MDFQDKILQACNEFKGEWPDLVSDRVLFVLKDLPVADAVYHNICSVNFRTGKQVPNIFKQAFEQKAAKYRKISGGADPKIHKNLKPSQLWQ